LLLRGRVEEWKADDVPNSSGEHRQQDGGEFGALDLGHGLILQVVLVRRRWVQMITLPNLCASGSPRELLPC
jgi:hypothetical protein